MHEIIQLGYEIGPLTPSTKVASFLGRGHVMETIDLGPRDRKIIALFFGPGEFVVKCHPFSELRALDDLTVNNFTHGQVIDMLRKFPELHHHYREIRRTYQQKVAARQASLTTMSDKARFEDMLQKQPWILELVQPDDIASYLHVSPSRLHELIKSSATN
jgi:hypothetical protein